MTDTTTLGKRVSVLVQEQLQYCRSLRRSDMLSVMQEVATDEECLKKANSLLLLLKGDVRALNACAARIFLPPHGGSAVDMNRTGAMARRAYSVESMERLLRKFRPVDPTESESSIRAVSNLNQLILMRERLQAGLSARLLELKADMDKEFGTAFVDMESYLRTEQDAKDTQASSDAEHCSVCARSFVELVHKFQVMVHACRGLRTAKQGLNQTMLLKVLREERDALTSRLGDAEAELKRIHHSYTEMITPEVAAGLENRQRNKLEEQEADITRLKAEVSVQKRDHDRVLAENGRLSDTVGELQSQLLANKEQYGRELAWLTPKVAKAESRAAEIEGLVDQTNLRLFLLGSSHKKSSEEIQDLKTQLSMARDDRPGAKICSLQEELSRYQATIKQLKDENDRKSRLLTVALTARAEAVTEYRALKNGTKELETRYEEMKRSWDLLEAQKREITRQLSETQGRLSSAEQQVARTVVELERAAEDLDTKTHENVVVQQRLDDQELSLRDYSNLQKDFTDQTAAKGDLADKLTSLSGDLEAMKAKAIALGVGRELGVC